MWSYFALSKQFSSRKYVQVTSNTSGAKSRFPCLVCGKNDNDGGKRRENRSRNVVAKIFVSMINYVSNTRCQLSSYVKRDNQLKTDCEVLKAKVLLQCNLSQPQGKKKPRKGSGPRDNRILFEIFDSIILPSLDSVLDPSFPPTHSDFSLIF